MKTIEQVIKELIDCADTLQYEVAVKIVRRNEGGAVVEEAIVPISYILMNNLICVEEKDIV